jgi:hypothetical protein
MACDTGSTTISSAAERLALSKFANIELWEN